MSAVVGFDTATADTVVAATRDGETVFEARREPAAPGRRPVHVTALLVDIEAAAEALGGWNGVDRIAVGVGPGSFTGLRVGIATARGLAQALGMELAGVGTLAALAAGMSGVDGDSARPRLAVLDARRGELFAALHGPGGHEDWAPFVVSPEELARRLAGLSEAPLAAGDGSVRFRAILEAAGALVPPDSDPVHRVSASRICALVPDEVPGGISLEPVYLRRPDAELWREQQARHQKADEQA